MAEMMTFPETFEEFAEQYKIIDDNLGVDTPKNRFNNNIEAINILYQKYYQLLCLVSLQ